MADTEEEVTTAGAVALYQSGPLNTAVIPSYISPPFSRPPPLSPPKMFTSALRSLPTNHNLQVECNVVQHERDIGVHVPHGSGHECAGVLRGDAVREREEGRRTLAQFRAATRRRVAEQQGRREDTQDALSQAQEAAAARRAQSLQRCSESYITATGGGKPTREQRERDAVTTLEEGEPLLAQPAPGTVMLLNDIAKPLRGSRFEGFSGLGGGGSGSVAFARSHLG